MSRMPRSLKVRSDYIDIVRIAWNRRGYSDRQAGAQCLQISVSTLNKFLGGKPVDRDNFKRICDELEGINWEDVADFRISEPLTDGEENLDFGTSEPLTDGEEEEPERFLDPEISEEDPEPLFHPNKPVEANSRFYIQRATEREVHRQVREPGALLRIYAPRWMGKTSLLNQIFKQAKMQGDVTVNLNLKQAEGALSSPDSFLQWFCASVALKLKHKFNLEAYRSSVELVGSSLACQSYFEEDLLPEVNQAVVLGLDKIDELFNHPDICREFFALLRIFHEDSGHKEVWQKLRLILVYSRDIRVYVPLPSNKSPFNVGVQIELTEFTAQEIQALAELHQLNWSDAEVQSLMEMVGGYPFLVRLALYHVAQRDITLPKLVQTAATPEGKYIEHLRSIWHFLAQKPELSTAMQAVVAGDSTHLRETTQHDLRSLGLVKFEGDAVVPSCELYRQYFQNPQ